MHDGPVSLQVVAGRVAIWLGGLVDQHVVGGWGGARPDGDEGIERRVPRSATIEAEHELVEVMLEVCPAQPW